MPAFDLHSLRGKLIVSCQALPGEPLHSSFIMGRMALAATQGGAAAIRCNTQEDIAEIRKNTDLPLLGIVKRDYEDSEIFITPTLQEVKELVDVGVEIIAMDATDRLRPEGQSLKDFMAEVKQAFPEQLFMADCSTYEDGIQAAELGFDIISSTMAGYTPGTKGRSLPALDLIRRWSRELDIPVIAEGGISTPEDLAAAFEAGAFAVVVGGAITRPLQITQRFAAALPQTEEYGD